MAAWQAIVLSGLLAGGCVWERNVDRHLARMQLGVNARRVAADPPPADDPPGVARTTRPERPASSPPPLIGGTGALQFTMRFPRYTYFGAELEAGPMHARGSYYGGAYGVAGAEAASDRGSLSVEVVAGRRWLRAGLGAEDVGATVLEPRVRAQLALAPQVTLGGVIGASALPDERGWMAGIYVGTYSLPLDGAR